MISTSHGNSKIVKNTFVAPVVPELGIIAPLYTVWDHCALQSKELFFGCSYDFNAYFFFKSWKSDMFRYGDNRISFQNVEYQKRFFIQVIDIFFYFQYIGLQCFDSGLSIKTVSPAKSFGLKTANLFLPFLFFWKINEIYFLEF